MAMVGSTLTAVYNRCIDKTLAVGEVSGRQLCGLLFACVLATVFVEPARATIIVGNVTGGTAFAEGGVFIKLTPPLPNTFGTPNSVGNDTFQTKNLYGFDEDQNILLTAALAVNLRAGGGSSPLPVGTTVASHYIFFDPLQVEDIVGTVDFDSDVLAIIWSTTNLQNSDFLANTGVNYLSPGARGLEGGDQVTISGARQITVDVAAATPGDYVRVLTAFSPTAAGVPEPSSAVLYGIALVGMSAWTGWRKRKGK